MMQAAASRLLRSRRFLLAVALGAVLPLALLAGFAIREAGRSDHAADESRLRATVRGLVAVVDAQLGAYVAAARALSHGPMLDEGADPAQFEANARPVGREFGGWVVALGPPPELRMLANTLRQPGQELPDLRQAGMREALALPLGRVFGQGRPGVSDLFLGPLVGRPVIWSLAPVRRGESVTRAVALGVEPAALRDLLMRQETPEGGHAVVADGRLRILAHSLDPAGLRLGLPMPDWVTRAAEGRPHGILRGPDGAGQEMVYAFERPGLAPGWIVAVAAPAAALGASAREAMAWLLAGGASLLLGLGIIGWAGWRQALLAARQEAEALRAGRGEIERLHAGLPALIFLRSVEPDGRSTLLYRGGDIEAVMGWPREVVARSAEFAEFAAPGAMPLRDFLCLILRAGSLAGEWRMRQPDGSWRWMRTHGQVLSRRPDGGGEIVGYVLNVQAEREAAARAAASGRLAALGEMAAGLAHELKQPLAIITLAAQNADNALRNGRPEGAAGRLGRIAAQARRAGEMIEHLRRFARGAAEDAAPQPVPLQQAVEGALALVGGALREAEVSLDLALGPPPGPVVLAQLVPLEQVLVNLLANARDALAALPPQAPRRVCIAARTDEPSGQVRITVTDNAGGIPQAVLERIFEPFVTTKDVEKGTGLGLSICHGLVGGMGGTITARNEADGAVFTILLPAAPAVAAAEPART
ncbi:ATP-binding protein [Roseicella aerolata]|uniref:histidine kinase n=1 Tax=Roseicella aerolata TaxID=2883479 RepID=A0A9X1IJ59_9PROT|nr:ATP-binding protein [Roseicella aerolata]MCB4824323.1 hypothetical protein [Roseicella aerolata]